MTGGEASYFGFEYQIHASVLLMLIEHQKSGFEEFRVENDFGNDAEAVVRRLQELESAEMKDLDVSISSRTLSKQIQIKTKSPAYSWQPHELRKVLLKQDESYRDTEGYDLLDLLTENKDQIFVFVTNGRVDRKLSSLLSRIDTLERLDSRLTYQEAIEAIVKSARSDGNLHQSLGVRLTNEVIERVFVVEGLSIEDIDLRIGKILTGTYGIPFNRTSHLVQRLVDLVRSRLLKQDGRGHVSGDDLEAIVGKVGPKAPYPQWEDSFIETPHYQIARKRLDASHIVILSGEPCIGKTTIGEKLVNDCSKEGFDFKLSARSDAPSDIQRAIISKNNTVFLLDDVFGSETYDSQSEAIGNQLPSVVKQLQNANGRVKVVITTRASVLAETKRLTRLGSLRLDDFIVQVPFPDPALMQDILSASLREVDDSVQQSIMKGVAVNDFENLLHIAQFSEECARLGSTQPEDLKDLVIRSKPSAYSLWISEQPDQVRLLLYSLWALIKTNQFAWEDDLRRVFECASECIKASSSTGFGSLFDQVLDKLRNGQSRIGTIPNGAIDFVHPTLRRAVEDFLLNEQVGSPGFLICFFERLAMSNHPLPQSVAVMLALNHIDRANIPRNMLDDLYMSPYVKTLETVIRFGGGTYRPPSEIDDIGDASDVDYRQVDYRLLFRPHDCTIDDNGLLVRGQHYPLASWDEVANSISWRYGEIKEPDLLQNCERALNEEEVSHLNELERVRFGYWLIRLWQEDKIDEPVLHRLLTKFASDPISFVREVAAHALGVPSILVQLGSQDIFNALCYDYHPYVKIAMLEEVILPNWRYQEEQRQEIWLNIAQDMLQDPVVRLHTAMGLIDISGDHYEYHADHSVEQKLRWFVEMAPSLVQHGFEHWVHFDRLLTKFDEHFGVLPIQFRTGLLRSIANYIKANPYYSRDTLYTIERIVIEHTPSEEEIDILFDLTKSLSTWGRMRLGHTFASEFQQLPDQRFKDFVHRPFFNETPLEFMAERAATILGYLSSESTPFDVLPAAVQEFSDREDVSEAIRRYVFAQDDLFKKIFVLAAYRYEQVYHVGWNDERNNPIVRDLINHFSSSDAIEDAVLIADVVITSGYHQTNEHRFGEDDEWFKLVRLFLYNQEPETCKRVCDIVLACNIPSSVHSARDFLMLFYLALNHDNSDVAQYGFTLFDTYFHDVWKQVQNPRHPASWQEEKKETWRSRHFLEKLHENSQAFSNWLNLAIMLNDARKYWDESSPDLQMAFVILFSSIARTGTPEQVDLARIFLDDFKEKISPELKTQLEDAIYIEQADGRRVLRGRSEQLLRNQQLEKRRPQVDWEMYLS